MPTREVANPLYGISGKGIVALKYTQYDKFPQMNVPEDLMGLVGLAEQEDRSDYLILLFPIWENLSSKRRGGYFFTIEVIKAIVEK